MEVITKSEISTGGANLGWENAYRIFSIKRRGLLFKTRPHRPGVYSNPAFIRGPAFIY